MAEIIPSRNTQPDEKTRHTPAHPCPVCGGHDAHPKGQGTRCAGFTAEKPDARMVYCTRPQHAGDPTAKKQTDLGGMPAWLHILPRDAERLPKADRPKPSKTTKYDYPGADGKPYLRAVRYDFADGGKTFAVFHHDGQGRLEKGQGGRRPVLYRLPELAAADPARPVYLAEGEKCADALAGLGLTATTNMHGAGKWRDEYAEALAGLDVVIFPDNDDPGRKHAAQAARSLFGKAARVRVLDLPGLPEKGDVADWIAAGGTREALEELAAAAPEWTPEAEPPAEGEGEAAQGAAVNDMTIAMRLLDIASRDTTLIHGNDARLYGRINVNGHAETHELRSTAFAGWLRRRYRQETGGKIANPDAVRSAVQCLEDDCLAEGETADVFLRVGSAGGNLYLDLCDADWRAVEIRPDGWDIVDRPPVHFRRAKGMRPLPEPARGPRGIDRLRDFVNVQEADNFHLVTAWLAAAFRPGRPFPVLLFQGEQGSAKSTTARLVRDLIDPNATPSRSTPREERDLMISAHAGHVLNFDNISRLPDWLSDAFCRIATGGGFSTRSLYTNDEEELFDAMRPLVLNGITEVATRPDLLERALIVPLDAIPDDGRIDEEAIWDAFRAAQPEILAGLLDAVSAALSGIAAVKLDRLPRMADFAKWATAAETALGMEPGGFMAVYNRNRAAVNENAIEADPLASAIVELIEGTAGGEWEGNATQLLADLEGTQTATDAVKKMKAWPKAANSLSRRLPRIATLLRSAGIEWAKEHRDNGSHVRLWRVGENIVSIVIPSGMERNHLDSTEDKNLTISHPHPDDTLRPGSISSGSDSIPSGTQANKNQLIRVGSDDTDGSDGILRTSPGSPPSPNGTGGNGGDDTPLRGEI